MWIHCHILSQQYTYNSFIISILCKKHLLKQEVLEGETLDAYLAKAQMPPGIDEWLKAGEVAIALAQASN